MSAPALTASFYGRSVRVGDCAWEVPYSIKDVRVVGDRLAVLFDYMAGPLHHQFRNLFGYDLRGTQMWVAEHPSSDTADVYVQFMDGDPLVVWSLACFVCVIDPQSGRLIKATFTK
jgi:hypothetical protein